MGAAAAAASASGTSSIVSWTVAMVLSPGTPVLVSCLSLTAETSLSVLVGASRMRALDVFFWRRESVLLGVLRRAAVGEGWRVRL